MKFYSDVISRTFDNGLRVFVFPQPGTAVEVECFIRTGSIHEGANLGCGLSHFLEHMLFQGCRDYPGTAAADAVDRLGGSMNAYTSYDHTAYHINISGRHLETAVKILSSMVRHPEFPESRFNEEREVILREEEMGRDNPDRRLYDHLNSTVFQVHPLRYPIIGCRSMIADVSREMMQAYYQERYTPGRCFWVIVGDVEPQAAFELVEAQMGDWKPRNLLDILLPPEPPQCAMRLDEFEFTDPLARLAIGVQVPPISDPDIAACDVLAGILGMGDGSRLVRHLELELQLAVNLRSFCYSQGAGGLLAVTASATPKKLARLESALKHELDRLRQRDLSRAEVEREKSQQIAEHLRELRGIREIAANIGGGVIAGGTPDLSDVYLERLSKLSVEELNSAAEKYLNPDRFSLVRQYSGSHASTSVKRGKTPELAPRLTRLENGVRCVTLSDRRLPLVDFAVVLPGGTIFETAGNGGISGLTADLLTAGTRRFSESELLKKLDAGGANVNIHTGLNSFMIECTCPRRSFGKVFPLLKEILSAPVFGDNEFRREKTNRLELLKSRALSPRAAAEDRCRRLLFGSHPYSWGNTGDAQQLAGITRDAVEAFYRSLWTPGQTVFGWGGDCTESEAAAWTAELCGAISWSSRPMALPPPPQFPREALCDTIELPREQTMVTYAVPGPALSGKLLSECEILFQAENGLSSPIFKLVREQNALAYATGMRLCGGFHPGWLLFYAVTTAEQSQQAAALLRHEMERLANTGLSQEEFSAAREGAAFAAARAAESVSSALGSTLLALHYDHSLDDVWKHEQELRKIEWEAFNAALRDYLSNPAAVQVSAGRQLP